MNQNSELAHLIKAGLEATGINIPVEQDSDCLVVRDLLIEMDGKTITCLSAADGIPKNAFNMPASATVSAAAAVVLRLVGGIVTREIEAAHSLISTKDCD